MRGYYQDPKMRRWWLHGHHNLLFRNYIQAHVWAAYSARLSFISNCRKNGLRFFVGRISFASWAAWRAHSQVWTIAMLFTLTSPRAVFTQM